MTNMDTQVFQRLLEHTTGTDCSGKWISIEAAQQLVTATVRDCISQIAMLGVTNFENEDVLWTVDVAVENLRQRYGMPKST